MSNGAISQAAVYYSERDSLKLRNMFFKIVEEMRMRRVSSIHEYIYYYNYACIIYIYYIYVVA